MLLSSPKCCRHKLKGAGFIHERAFKVNFVAACRDVTPLLPIEGTEKYTVLPCSRENMVYYLQPALVN